MDRDAMIQAFEAHGRAERAQDLAATMATVHPEGVWEEMASGEVWRGTAEIRRFYEELFAALDSWSFVRRAVHVTDANIISEVRITGTHAGPFLGLAATGLTLTLDEIVVFSFKDGLVAGERMYMDRLGALRQLEATRG